MSYQERLQVIGDIGSSEIKTSGAGATYLKISVAVNKKDREGNKKTFWYQAYIIGQMAKNLNLQQFKEDCAPGRLVQIIGTPHFSVSEKGALVTEMVCSEVPLLLDKRFARAKPAQG